MKATHGVEAMLARALAAGVGALSWPAGLALGVRLGDATRAVGLRRRVAEDNLALAFPERSAAERAAILVEHYRELGRIVCEYPRMGELVRAPGDRVVAAVRGLEHLAAARAGGRGAILLTGHYGHFELLGAWLGRENPVDFVVKPLSNPAVDRLLARRRADAGVGTIPIGAGVRAVFQALRRNRWVAMVADQDAHARGVFVPFFGRLASTPPGPAAIALRSGAPIVMGFAQRRSDGRHELDVLPPLPMPAGPDAVRDLTARHTACLESWVRRRPEAWFWLHRRWKTAPPPGGP